MTTGLLTLGTCALTQVTGEPSQCLLGLISAKS